MLGQISQQMPRIYSLPLTDALDIDFTQCSIHLLQYKATNLMMSHIRPVSLSGRG